MTYLIGSRIIPPGYNKIKNCPFIKVDSKSKKIVATGANSIDGYKALAWCTLNNGEMILSSERVKFNDAFAFCKKNNGQLWTPEGRLITSDFPDKQGLSNGNWSSHYNVLKIFNLFFEETKISKGSIPFESSNDIQIAWTNIHRIKEIQILVM